MITIGYIQRDYIHRKLGDLDILFNIHETNPQIYTLNNTGKVLWDYIQKFNKISDVRRDFAKTYKISIEQATKDIDSFLKNIIHPSKQVSSRLSENNILQALSKTTGLIKASFEITGKCNLNCIHCYALPERKKNDLTTEQIKSVIEKLAEMGVIYINFTGGECTSRADFEEIYRFAKSKGMFISLITNGTLLVKKNFIKLFKELPPAFIKISLYGPDAQSHDSITCIPGSFNATSKSINLLKKNNINFYIATLAFKGNFSKLKELKNKALKIGAPIKFYRRFISRNDGDTLPFNNSIDKTYYKKFSKLNKNFSVNFLKKPTKSTLSGNRDHMCPAGKSEININCEGKVYLCTLDRRNGVDFLANSKEEIIIKLKEKRDKYLKFGSNNTNCPLLINRSDNDSR